MVKLARLSDSENPGLSSALLLLLFITFQRPPPTISLSSPQAQLRLAWPWPLSHQLVAPGVWCGCQRRLCSLTGPILLWPLAASLGDGAIVQVSEVAAVLPKSSERAGESGRRQKTNGEACWGFSVMSPPALSSLGPFESRLTWGQIRFLLRSRPSRCFVGLPPSSLVSELPLLWSLRALGSHSARRVVLLLCIWV